VILLSLVLWCFAAQQAPSAGQSPDEDAVRAQVQQYFAAQAAKDADKAASVWSPTANPRPTRETFVALFGVPDQQDSVDIQSVSVKGAEARVRVEVHSTRTLARNGQPFQMPIVTRTAERWRKEGATWKLVRDTSPEDDFAEDLLAADASDRTRLIAENAGQMTSAVRYALAQRASALITSPPQNYAKAREIFAIVLDLARASSDRRAEGDALQNIANAHYFLREYDKSVDFYQQRLALAKDMDDAEATGAALIGLATVDYARGEYPHALDGYRDALAIYEKREDGNAIGRTLISVGNVQFLQADYDAAAGTYRRALGLLIAGSDRQTASFARSGLARVLAAQGDFAAALDTYGQVLGDARATAERDPRLTSGIAVTLESIGEVHFRIGNMDQARSAFDEARRLMDAVPSESARLLMSLGLTELVAGKYETAFADYTESRTRYEKAKDDPGVARAWVGVGFSLSARQKFDDAIAAYKTAIRMFERQSANGESAHAWLGLSLAQSGAGDNTAALDSARKVTVIADGLKSEDLAWRGSVRTGEALEKLAHLDDARASFQVAIEIIDKLAAQAPVNPDMRRELDDSASAWAGLALTLAKAGDPRGALNAMEARRAHVRRMHLAGFQRDIAMGMSDDERKEEAALARELAAAYALLKAEQSARRPDPARLERLGQQLQTLSARRAEQQARLYAKLPDLERWRGLTSPPDVDIAALAPADDVALLEYLVTDDEVLMLAVDRHEDAPEVTSATIAVTRHDLADKVAAAMKPAVLQDAAAWRIAAEPLRGLLIASVSDKLRDRTRCVIVPDDVLWKVPFEALPDGMSDLAGRMTVSYATSLTTLALERAVPAKTQADPPRVNAGFVAAPTIPEAIRAQLRLTQPGWKEPDAVAALARGQESAKPYAGSASVRTGAEATEAALRALLGTADVLQVSAPFHVSGPSPLFSSLLLAGTPDTAPDDVRWEAREWFEAKGATRLLVIDDSSTFGAAGAGGALDTLAWAAAAAGIPALVVARWPSDAFVLDALEPALHSQLAQGRAAGDALRAAATAAHDKSTAPSAWAGLRLIGGS
jgi:tetratricopeptide (TPR) repeat protein